MLYRALAVFFSFALVACVEPGTLSVDEPEDEPLVVNTGDSNTSVNGSTNGSSGIAGSTNSTNAGGGGGGGDPMTPMCLEGQALCDGACIDVTEDDANCGDCGVQCGDGQICAASECGCEVGELCGSECVDTTMNQMHCGECDNPCVGGQVCVDGGCMQLTEVEAVVAATNQARAEGQDCGAYGVFDPAPPLDGDPNLHIAAQAHADDMSQNDFFSHTGSDGSSFAQRIGRTDFSGQPLGENIAAGQRSPEEAVAGWIDSDGHCRNLMNPNATKIGVGYQTGGPYGTLWVQVFAR
jgi:hypothetical protein